MLDVLAESYRDCAVSLYNALYIQFPRVGRMKKLQITAHTRDDNAVASGVYSCLIVCSDLRKTKNSRNSPVCRSVHVQQTRHGNCTLDVCESDPFTYHGND